MTKDFKTYTGHVLFVDQFNGPLTTSLSTSLPDLSISFFKSFSLNRASLLTRFLSWSVYSIHLFIHLFLNPKKYDLVIFFSNPPIILFFVWFYPGKYIVYIYDLYPTIAFKALSVYLPPFGNFIAFLLRPVEFLLSLLLSLTLIRASFIFTVSSSIVSCLRYFPFYQKFIHKVDILYPFSSFPPISSPTSNDLVLPALLGVDLEPSLISFNSKPYFLYTGNIGLSHPVHYFFDIVLNFPSPDAFNYVFVLNSSSCSRLVSKLRTLSHRFPNIYFVQFQSVDILSRLVTDAAFCLVATDAFSSKFSIPSKLFSYISASAPVLSISPYSSELSSFVLSNEFGVVYDPSCTDLSILSSHILSILSSSDRLDLLSTNASAAYIKHSGSSPSTFSRHVLDLL